MSGLIYKTTQFCAWTIASWQKSIFKYMEIPLFKQYKWNRDSETIFECKFDI